MEVGIITFYHKSSNYGGILQAYALCSQVNKWFYTQQILYNCAGEKVSASSKSVRTIVKHVVSRIINKKRNRTLRNRIRIFDSFRAFVSQSEIEYNAQNICDCLNKYDIFITGSDQVWNTQWYDEVYRLDFVPSEKYKFSYAAGVSSVNLNMEQQEVFRRTLSTYDAISVREKSAVKTLQPLTNKNVEWVLDPTLLLSREEWDKICSIRKVKDKYIFCYFLGSLSLNNKKIIEFAHKRGLKVVTMPYLAWTSKKDSDFGDYKIYDAAPQDFISLIKYAEYVFTDSFHATVFSHIYKKNFFVFNRAGLKSMNDRIYSLTSLFDTQDRFCDTKEKISLKYIEGLPPINYDRPFPKFEEMKEKSINFLKDNLKKAEEKIHGNK